MPDDFDAFIRLHADRLRAADADPPTLAAWTARRAALRDSLMAALGAVPARDSALDVKLVRTLKRAGYRVEVLSILTRPGVWMSATAYVPDGVPGKVPAVLAVHGHWPMARRDPVVQARCLGLVKLGFFVLCVDAFGAGERHPKPARGAYHGGLLGSAMWPAGLTLPGTQVYDNRRAVDYLVSRPEVDANNLGISGASGGGNQTMYAGALDERFKAVVPVCSVGTYRAYLKAACCVCEVVPGALRFAEEGDVLGLVAPRALMVINATRDAFQFSVGEARKSLARASAVFALYGKSGNVRHTVFESGHDYSRPMREAVYGWMALHLQGKGKGEPIAEPAFTVDSADDLAVWPEAKRPEGFLFPASLAAREAKKLLAYHTDSEPDHREAFEAHAGLMRTRLAEALGPMPALAEASLTTGTAETTDAGVEQPFALVAERGLTLRGTLRHAPTVAAGRRPAVIVVHLDGTAAALKHAVTAELVRAGKLVYALTLRSTSAAGAGIAGAPDHNPAEHAVWNGRPLLGQWCADVRAMAEALAASPRVDPRRVSLVGLSQAGTVAVAAAAALGDRLYATAAVDFLSTWVTEEAYTAGTRMGLLAPGVLKAGDVCHLASLAAPRRLMLHGAFSPQGKPLDAAAMASAFDFTKRMYRLMKAETALSVAAKADALAVAAGV